MDWTLILLGALGGGVVLFVWYAVAWMALPHHKKDFRGVQNPGPLEAALSNVEVQPVFYSLPFMDDYDQGMKDPAFIERMNKGPNALLLMMPPPL